VQSKLFKDKNDIFDRIIMSHFFDAKNLHFSVVFNLTLEIFIFIYGLGKFLLIIISDKRELWECDSRVNMVEEPCVHVVSHDEIKQAILVQEIDVPIGESRDHETIFSQIKQGDLSIENGLRAANIIILLTLLLSGHRSYIQIFFEIIESHSDL